VAGRSAQTLLDAAPGGAGGGAVVQRDEKKGAETPAETLERVVVMIEEELTIAAFDTAKAHEREKIQEHAHAVALLLEGATRTVRSIPNKGDRWQLEPLVKRLEDGIERLYAWGRTIEVFQDKFELETVFDRWDALRQSVGMDPKEYARSYYADWKLQSPADEGDFGVADPNQRELVAACVGVFETGLKEGRLMAIEQFSDILDEPAAPAEGPDFLERMLGVAISMVLGAIPGKLGGVVEAVLGDDEPGLAKVIVGFTENAGDLVVDMSTGEGAEKGEEMGEGAIRTRYLSGIRKGALSAIGKTGAAVARYRSTLERLPPHKLAEVYRTLTKMPDALWAKLKQDIVVNWVNFRASLPHGLVEGHEDRLDIDRSWEPEARKGEKGFDAWKRRTNYTGQLCMSVYLNDNKVTHSAPTLEGVEPAVREALADADTPFMHLLMHRVLDVMRVGDDGEPHRMGWVYVTPHGEMVPLQVDDYFMAKFGRGESLDAPWDAPGHADEEQDERARSPSSANDVRQGMYRIVGKIKMRSSDLK
jgi:hypothetical protein